MIFFESRRVDFLVFSIAISASPSLLPSLVMPEEAPNDQERRTALRRDFLLAVESLRGRECDITLTNGVQSKGSLFRGCDRDGLHLAVENLQTPAGAVEHAIVRATDVKSVSFDAQDLVKKN